MGRLSITNKTKMKTESRIQQEIFMWYQNNYCLKSNNPRHLIFSVPNEGKSKKESLQKKAMGMISGVSDLIIVKPDEVVFCEVKTETGRQSENQIKFETAIKEMNYRYILVRSLEDFKNQIKLK